MLVKGFRSTTRYASSKAVIRNSTYTVVAKRSIMPVSQMRLKSERVQAKNASGIAGFIENAKQSTMNIVRGVKQIYKDAILSNELHQKRRLGEVLTLNALELIRTSRLNVLYCTPILIFCVPIVGYVTPLFWLVFPEMLPTVLWDAKFFKKLVLRDALRKKELIKTFPQTLRDINKKNISDNKVSQEVGDKLDAIITNAENKQPATQQEILDCADALNAISLTDLSLSQLFAISMSMRQAQPIPAKDLMVKFLKRGHTELRDIDQACHHTLNKPNASSNPLEQESLERMLIERQLWPNFTKEEDKKQQLKEYLDLSVAGLSGPSLMDSSLTLYGLIQTTANVDKVTMPKK